MPLQEIPDAAVMSAMTPTDVTARDGDPARDDCMVHDTGEIRRLLHRLLDARSVMVGQADGAAATHVTALLRVDEASLLVDVPRAPPARREWLDSTRLAFRSSVDSITLGFASGPAHMDSHEGHPALRLPLPERLLYEQRREYLRIAPPGGGLRCRLPARDGGGPADAVEATIRDIGGGGLSLLVPGTAAPFAVGDVLEQCVVDLPRQEPVTTALRICHVVACEGPGPRVLQAGCEFVDLPRAAQDRLFRYLMQLDRERVSRRRAWE